MPDQNSGPQVNLSLRSGLHEHSFNFQLAKSLRESTSRWRRLENVIQAERTGKSERIDILVVDEQMPTVAIDCAYGGDRDLDAKARLDENLQLNTAVSVAIPTEFQSMTEDEALEALLNRQQIGYAVLQREALGIHRFPDRGYIFGSAADLASLIQSASASKRSLENIGMSVAELVNRAADTLEQNLSARDIELIAKNAQQHTGISALRTIAILWLDAMLVQSHLRQCDTLIENEPIDHIPRKLESIGQIVDAWERIRSLNWASIFTPSVDAPLRTEPTSRKATATALEHLATAVDQIETSRLGCHIQVGAELFPRIITDRKEVAAFYTTPATAELLSYLLIRETDPHDWRDNRIFANLKVADLACGTGTLVRAAYLRIRSFLEADGASDDQLAELHKDAMERGITAADISPIAAHLTNSSLAMMGHGEPYSNTSIGWVSVGEPVRESQELTAGSLEFLKSDNLVDMFSNLGAKSGGDRTSNFPIEVRSNSLDYIIMNPPYSRTRGGQSAFDIEGLSEEARRLCQNRWGKLIKGIKATKTAGMAASFVCLAREKVKLGGRIGFVLPLTAAFAQSWAVTRKMLVEEFDVIVAVSRAGSRDRESLSADTHLAEMLLVATRRKVARTYGKTVIHCVVLEQMPIRNGEAAEVARSIQKVLQGDFVDGSPIMLGNSELGRVVRFEAHGEEPWSHLGVLNTELAVYANKLSLGAIPHFKHTDLHLPVTMTTIGDLFEVGPTHHLIGHSFGNEPIGAFAFYKLIRKSEARGENRALWQANAKSQNSLVVTPTHRGLVHNKEHASRISDKKGTLHYARGIRWTSQALVAATTESPTFGGSAWTTLIHEDIRVCRAFALWANSIFGLLVHWTHGSRTQGGRARMQVKAIKDVPCPDLSALEDASLDLASSAFETCATQSLRPACEAHADDTRHQIDDVVADMLNLPKSQATDVSKTLRDWWCAEPTVHGYKQRAQKLLKEAGLGD